MAGCSLLRIFLFLVLIQKSEGQDYYQYYYGDYSDYDFCPFGTSGTCDCQGNTINCTGQGFTSVPGELSSSITTLVLRDNQISSITEQDLSLLQALEQLDLSSNNLQSLPSGIFASLPNLRQINLANNPWRCNCSLTWLRIWLHDAEANGLEVLGRDSTTCQEWPGLSLLDVSPAIFSPCAAGSVGEVRAVRSPPEDWKRECRYWFEIDECARGPSLAGSCVYSPDTRQVAVIAYNDFSSQNSAGACRNHCFSNGFTFYAHQHTENSCLCGDDTSTTCSDCTASSISSVNLTLCSATYMRIPSALHVLSGVDITFASPILAQSSVSLTVAGHPSNASTFTWDFGDSSVLVTGSASISHIYLYPGLFPLSVELCGAGVCKEVKVAVKVDDTQVKTELQCPSVSEVSSKIATNLTLSDTYSAEVKWTRQSSTGTITTASSCSSGWSLFVGKCIQRFSSPLSFTFAQSSCQSKGGNLLSLSLMQHVLDLPSVLALSPGDTAYIGAQYDGSVYMWTINKAATFLQALNIDRSAGTCLVVTATGLEAAACSSDHEYICQKESVQCPEGELVDGHCFYTSVVSRTWSEAQQACQGAYGGDLAVIGSASRSSSILSALSLTSPAWFGLSAPDLLGHYVWVNGEVPAWTDWASSSSSSIQWPCVALTSSGQWEAMDCNSDLISICEYTLNNETESTIQVTGSGDLQLSGSSITTVTEDSSIISLSMPFTFVMPGVWFTGVGQLTQIHLRLEASAPRNILVLQILRPTCPSPKAVVRPGCANNMFTECDEASVASSCPALPACTSAQYPCLLTDLCQDHSTPCSCAGNLSVSADCSMTDHDPEVIYTVVGKVQFEVPLASTSGSVISSTVSSTVEVQAGDVVGFQTSDSSIGFCHDDTASASPSPWQQVAFSDASTHWKSVGDTVSLGTFSKLQGRVCSFRIVYTSSVLLSLPDSLVDVSEPGSYEFTAEVMGFSSAAKTCTVDVVQAAGEITWLFPALTQTNATPAVTVESGTSQVMVAMLESGSPAQVEWSLSSGESSTVALSSDCPGSLTGISQCQVPNSQLSHPFVVFQHTFPPSSSVTLTLNVSNTLGSKMLTVEVFPVTQIQDLVLFHSSCADHTSCRPLVAAEMEQQYQTEKSSGDIDMYEFSINGTVQSSSSSSQFTHIFAIPGLYLITVNASNALESNVQALMYVDVKMKANVHQESLQPLGTVYIEVSKAVTLNITAVISTPVELNITWSFGDGAVDTSTRLYTDTNLTQNVSHTYDAVGTYTVGVILTDPFGVSASLSTQVVVLTPITNLNTSVVPEVVLAGNQTIFTVQVLSDSSVNHNFSHITYNLNFGDSSSIERTITHTSKTVHHTYSTNGTYNVTITAENKVSSVTKYAVVTVQTCPSEVKLRYDGPKNISAQFTFTVNVTGGSDLSFTFDYGDGSALVTQPDPVNLYVYNTSGQYNASVTVENAICSLIDYIHVIVIDADTLILRKITHDRYAAVGSCVEFEVDVVTMDINLVTFVWATGSSHIPITGSAKVKLPINETVGEHTVDLSAELDKGRVIRNATTTVIIQEPVSNVTMQGPTMVSFSSTVQTVVYFSAIAVKGSDVEFRWAINDTSITSVGTNISQVMSTPGTFNISVYGYNKVSEDGDWMIVLVQHVVENIVITCVKCMNSMYTITGATDWELQATYLGTDVTTRWTTSSVTEKTEPVFKNYSYSSPGAYEIHLNVSNMVSWENATFTLYVQDSVSALNVTADALIVQEGSTVKLSAIHSEGTDVEYIWNCEGLGEKRAVSNIAHYSFTMFGLHTCNVTAHNNISSQQGSIAITVLQSVTSLGVLNHVPGQTLYVPVNKSPGVSVLCNTYFNTTFTWRVVQAQAVVITLAGSDLSYKFPSVGSYEINITGENAVSSKTVSIQVEALEEVTQLDLTASQTAVTVGSTVQLTATIATGSRPHYEWFIDGFPMTAISGNSSPYVFNSPGQFVVFVNVSNSLNVETDTVTIVVQHPLQDLQIESLLDFSHPYIAQNQQYIFTGNLSQGTDPVYKWTVQSPSGASVETLNQALHQTFSEKGTYTVVLDVSNAVSHDGKSFIVYVEKEITSLAVTVTPSIVATHDNVYFSAIPNTDASPVTYSWTVEGNVQPAESFMHVFNSAGTYSITVRVYNNISSQEEVKSVRVLDTVSALHMHDCSIVRTSVVSTVLAATALGTNVSFSWLVQFPSSNESAVGTSAAFIFPAAGSYPVTVWAENDVNKINTTCTIQVEDVIANVAVSITHPPVDYIFTNQNVTFLVRGDNLQGAEYVWTFAGLSTTTTTIPTYTTTFSPAQNVTLTLQVKNTISNMSSAIHFTVQDLKCNLPAVTHVGATSHTILRSKSIQFDVYINNQGCADYRFIHMWQVFEVADCTSPLPSTSLSLTSVDMDDPTLILPARYLPTAASQFCVCYTLGYENTPVAEKISYNLTVKASPLKCSIGGGTQRMVDGTRSFQLDGSLSYNPDNPGSNSGMQYTWECLVVSGSGSCFSPVTTSDSKLVVSTLSAGIYNISLTVSLSGHTSDSTYQIVQVIVTSPPVLSVGIRCESCQGTKQFTISSSHHTALSVDCYNCSCPLQYAWSVTEDDTTTAVSLGPSDTSTGTNASSLVVLRNTALKDKCAYTFSVTVTCTDGSGSSGTAVLTLQPNLPPVGGTCAITPTTIAPLTDTVTVSCQDWVDGENIEAVLSYKVEVRHGAQSYLLYYGIRQVQTMYLAPWPGTGTSATLLVVSVLDEGGARTEALQETISFSYSSISGSNTSQQLLSAAQTKLPTLMQQGDPVPLVQYALALTQLLNSATTASSGAQTPADLMAQTLVRTAVSVSLASGVSVSSLQQAQQLAYVLKLLTEYPEELRTSGSHELLLQSLLDIVAALGESAFPGFDREDFSFSALLSSAYRLMEAVNLDPTLAVSITTSDLTSAFPEFQTMTQELQNLLSALEFSSSISDSHKKEVVTKAFHLSQDIMSRVLQTLVVGESSVRFTLDRIVVEGSRVRAGSVGQYVAQNGCQFILPSNFLPSLISSDEVLKISTTMDPNPFAWSYIENLVITSRIPTLSFRLPDGSELVVSGLTDYIELIMFTSDGNDYSLSTQELQDSGYYNPQADLDLHSWQLEAGGRKKIVVDASAGKSGVSALFIQLRVEALANRTDSAGNTVTPAAVIQAYLGTGYEASENDFEDFKQITTDEMAPGVDHQDYTFFVSSENFKSDEKYYITVVNEDTVNAVKLFSGAYLASCQYYRENEREWSVDGCSVQETSIPIATVCHCNHLTAFGASSLVSITSINFSDLAGLDLGLNPVALAAISTILALYITVVIVCRYLDRADLQRISHVPLCGPDGNYKYHITVFTGRHMGAGTTAHVGLKLFGEKGKSEAWHLTKRAAFQRNTSDSFLVATDNELGQLHKLRVWHDNAGTSPCWYLTQIVIRDLQNGQRYIFPASSWLSLQMEDGKLQKEICAAGPEKLRSFSHVFTTTLSNSWAERHMWLSVLNRPDHNRFTRVQRATCCVTLVFLYMFVNAMWYGLVKDQADAGDSLTWGAFGWEEVVIAMVSTAVIFPVALILVFIFKRSKCKPDMFKQALRPQSAQTIEMDAMCDMSQYGGSYRTMTPAEDWMTLFERESTTESIPPISSQLRRTAPVNRSSRDAVRRGSNSGSSFPGSRGQSSVQCIRRTQDLMWNQENILKSWPEKLPSFAEEEKEKTTSSKASAGNSASAKSNSANTAKSSKASADKPSHSAATVSKSSTSAASNSPTASRSKTATTAAASKSASAAISKTSPSAATTAAAAKSKPTTATTTGTAKTNSAGSGKAGTKTTSFMTPAGEKLGKNDEIKPAKSEARNQGSGATRLPSKAPSKTTGKTTSFKTETEADSDEEFRQRLDEIDRELDKASASAKSKGSAKSTKSSQGSITSALKKRSSSSQGAIDDLFDSDDEWTTEGIDPATRRKREFNPRQDPHLDRRASVTSLMRLRAASMHVPSSAGGSVRDGSFVRRDSTFLQRDGTMHSFMMSEKSLTTLSAVLRNRIQVLQPQPEEGTCRLPWYFVYIGYIICLALVLVSIIMVLLYGYNFGPAVALKWLLSLVLTFLISALVLEPLKVLLMSLFIAIVVRDAEKDMEADAIDVQPLVEANEQLKEVKFRPLGGFALLQAQDEGRKKQRLYWMLRQTAAYLMLTAILLAVANVNFGAAFFRSADHIENNFVYTEDATNGSLAFYNISSQENFWTWAQDVLTPALYKYELMTDVENPVLLGSARLRQIRSTLVGCLTKKVEDSRQCTGRLDFTEDKDAYTVGWNSTSGANASWIHSSGDQLNTHPKFGQSLLYGGGGYVQELGISYNQTLSILQQLSSDEWLDRRSRALFMEWTVYSAARDIYSCVTLLLEFPISGGVLASHSITTQRLYIFSFGRIDPLYICQVLLLIPTIYLFVHVIYLMQQQRMGFVHHAGNWLELSITLLSLTCIGFYITCVALATEAFSDFTSNKLSFANFEHVASLHNTLRYLQALLLFFIFLKIAGQVRFIRPLSVFTQTLSAGLGRLAGATFIFLILLLTYTQAGYLFYGSFVSSFRSFQNSLVSLLGVVRGGEDLADAVEFQPIFSTFFFSSFYAFVYGLFVALVIAILQDSYKLTRSQMHFKSSLDPQDHEMVEFMMKRFKLWAGFIKPKPAFRHVRFEGLPSLPSRGSSSTTSSWRTPNHHGERHTPTPDLVPPGGNVEALDTLLPRWEKLLSLLGTVEAIEKDEQRQVKRMETEVDRWCTMHKKPSVKRPPHKKCGGPSGKPPINPNSKFFRFQSKFQSNNTDPAAKPPLPVPSANKAQSTPLSSQPSVQTSGADQVTKPAVPPRPQNKTATQPGPLASQSNVQTANGAPGTKRQAPPPPPSKSGATAPSLATQANGHTNTIDLVAKPAAPPVPPRSRIAQKIQERPASDQGTRSASLTQRPASDSQKVRPVAGGVAAPADSVASAKMQRPGSDSQRERPTPHPATGQRERPTPQSATGQAASAASATNEQRPSSDTPKTRQAAGPDPPQKGSGPGFPVKQAVKVPVKRASSSTDSSKQAWDG